VDESGPLALTGLGNLGVPRSHGEQVVPLQGEALAPIPRGWLLRRVERTRPWQLLPPGTRGALVTTSMITLAGVTIGLMSASHMPELLVWFYVSSVLPLLCAPMLAERRLKRIARQSPITRSLAERRRGEVVKVRGRVRAGPSFHSAGARQPVVLACYAGTVTYVTGHITDGMSRPWHETRGIDFSLDLESGETVRISSRGVYFLPQPPETRRLFWGRNLQALPTPLRRLARTDRHGSVTETIYGETNLRAGDEVEVIGVLDLEVRPEAAAGGRGARLHPVLKATEETPLLVERIGDER
jgi:hypothetical protein